MTDISVTVWLIFFTSSKLS